MFRRLYEYAVGFRMCLAGLTRCLRVIVWWRSLTPGQFVIVLPNSEPVPVRHSPDGSLMWLSSAGWRPIPREAVMFNPSCRGTITKVGWGTFEYEFEGEAQHCSVWPLARTSLWHAVDPVLPPPESSAR